ncbi:MAG TPA: hypothetical protein VLE73_02985, partial [Candidatus Saccharimonadales bacterium]|nr:hypothetical protein [Candidatus Saccharimonadales bacterium]
MDKPVSKHRQTVTKGQLEVLNLLFNFRYGTNDLFAAYFGKKDRSFVHKRMAILLERGLVSRRFDSSYRLHGKPGVYYLTAEGARQLQEARDVELNVKSIYKDKDLSEQFVGYSLELLTIYIQLRRHYGDTLGFFTRAILNHEDYEYFPQPLPNAYMTLKVGGNEKHFFLETLHDDQPWFVAVRKILQHIKYAEDGDWNETELNQPAILLVCESERLAKRVQKRIPKALADSYDEDTIEFAVTAKSELLGEKTAIWRTEVDGGQLRLEELDEWTSE